MVRLALTIVVLGIGGPRAAAPRPLPGVWVALPHHIAQTGRHGRVALLLRPRAYEVRVVSRLHCSSVRIRLSPRHARVLLRCSVP